MTRHQAAWVIHRSPITLLCVGLLAGTALGSGPSLQINWSVEHGPVNVVAPNGVELGGGMFAYEGAAVDPKTGLALNFDFTADGSGILDGAFNINNELERTIDVNVEVRLPMSVSFSNGSNLTSTVSIGLTTGAGGGMISSQAPALWQMHVDESVVGFPATLFFDPFFMANGGIGASATTQFFGVPQPVQGPPVFSSIGFELRFTVTDLDIAAVSTVLSADGCVGDFDGNGTVGSADLTTLLKAWGQCSSPPAFCPADLDIDGTTAVTDLLVLLANWGPC